MANEFVIKNGFHSKGDSQVTGSLKVSGSITGSLFGSASYAVTASYALNAGGGTGVGFPYDGRTIPAIISGSLIVTGSGITVTGSLLVSGTINQLAIGTGKGNNITNVAIGLGAGNKFTAAGTSGVRNVALGSASLSNTTDGSDNTGIGVATLQSLTTGVNNVAIGARSLFTAVTANSNIGIGAETLYNNTGDSNIAIGASALNNNTTGIQNVAIGPNALQTKVATRSSIIAIGASSGRNYSGETSVLIGIEAARYATGSDAIAIGSYAGRYVNRIIDSVAIGSYALEGISTGTANVSAHNNNIAIGKEAMRYWISQSNSTAIGPLAMQGRSAFPVGYEATATTQTANNVAIGLSSMQYVTRAANNTTIGFNALQSFDANIVTATASLLSSNVSIGAYSTQRMLSGDSNISIGGSALRYMTSGSRNIGIGNQALQGSNPGDTVRSSYSTVENTAIGNQALYLARSGSYNVAIGAQAAYSAADIQYSVYIGTNAGYARTIGEQNVVIGYGAQRAGTSGSFNTVIGTEASYQGLNSGNRGILIGYRTGYKLWSVATSSRDINSVVIGNEAMGDTQFSALGTYVGLSNTVIGDRALYNNRAGSYNVVAGTNVMYGNTNGNYNTTFGHNAMTSSTTADNTVAVGAFSLKNITTGDNNVAIGYQAGQFLNAASANNVIIGTNVGPSALTTLNNKLYIGNAAGNPLIGGDFEAKTVTISGSLYISGSIIPNVDATLTSSFELGSPTAAWNRIWVRSSSIHFVDDSGNELAKISATPAGAIELPNIYTSGTFTAQTFVTQSTTIIVEEYHATGSNIFGSSSLDTHQFTGSVLVSGAFYISDVQQAVGNNVLTYNTNNGRLYYTASSALIGPQGPAGTSTYQSWLNLGNSGTEQDFINSLKGDVGETGPIGPTGPVGEQGPTGDPGEPGLTVTDLFVNLSESLWNTTSSIQFSGSVNSLYGYTGSLFGTATTASYIDPVYISASAANYGFGSGGGSTDISALNTFTGSIQTQVNNLTAATSSYVVNSATSSMLAPYVLTANTSSMSVLSSSFAVTASYALNAPVISTGSFVVTSSFNSFTSSIQTQVNSLTSATSSYITNSITASMLNPYVLTSSTSSMSVLSSSYALTASYALNVPAIDTSALIGTASFNSFTSSIQNQVNNLVVATSSYVVNSITSSMLAPYTLLSVTSSMTVLSASYANTASFISANFISASVAASGFSSGTDISALNTFTGSIQTQVDSLTSATSSYVVNSVTGSMLAPYVLSSVTASMLTPYVLTASTSSMTVLSSSFAGTASFINNLVQNVVVTGSVIATTFTGSLRGHVVTSSINTSQSVLINNFGTAVDWANSSLGYSGVASVNWASRYLINNTNNTTVDWQNGMLNDQSGYISVAWFDRTLRDSSGVGSIGYSSRALQDSTGTTALSYATQNKVYTIGPLTTKLAPGFLAETEDSASPNYYAGEMYDAGENYPPPATQYGELLYLDYSTNEWTRIDQSTNVCTRYIGIDLDGKDGVLTEGHIVMTDAADPFAGGIPQIENPLIGMPVYIREGATGLFDNSYTCTIPTSGYVRVIGHVIYRAVTSGYESKYMIKFKPSNDWYEI